MLHGRFVSLVQQLLGEHEHRHRSAEKDHAEIDPGPRPADSTSRHEQRHGEEEGVENDPTDLFEAEHRSQYKVLHQAFLACHIQIRFSISPYLPHLPRGCGLIGGDCRSPTSEIARLGSAALSVISRSPVQWPAQHSGES